MTDDDPSCFLARPQNQEEALALYHRFKEQRETECRSSEHARASCSEMCPLLERLERQAHCSVDRRFEALPSTTDAPRQASASSGPACRFFSTEAGCRRKSCPFLHSDPHRTSPTTLLRAERQAGGFVAIDHSRAVCKYRRPTGQADDLWDARDIRPPSVLLATSEHLLTAVLHDEQAPLLARFLFIRDRLRAIGQHLTIQGCHDDPDEVLTSTAIVIYERIVRFYILFGYLLCEQSEADVDPFLNREQLQKAMTSLTGLYARRSGSPNEPEFRCYELLMALADSQPLPSSKTLSLNLSLLEMPDSVARSFDVQLALRLWISASSTDYHQFFACYRLESPVLVRCLVHPALGRLRLAALSAMLSSYRGTMSLAYFTEELAFADEQTATDFLASSGLVVSEGRIDFKSSLTPSQTPPIRLTPRFVEAATARTFRELIESGCPFSESTART